MGLVPGVVAEVEGVEDVTLGILEPDALLLFFEVDAGILGTDVTELDEELPRTKR